MTKKTKMWLIGGVAAAAVVAGGVYVYEKNKTAPPAAPAALPSGAPVTAFTAGQSYKFAALLPSSINDTSALETALTNAGWKDVNILYFMGTGDSGPFPVNTSGYVAQGTWNGASGTALPSGVVAVVA